MTLTYRVFTSLGDREVNEDCVGEIKTSRGHNFVVADGLGGHGHGEIASEIAVSTSLKIFAGGNDTDVIEKSFILSQKTILQEQEKNPELADMKTTLVDLIIREDKATWGHIGDSRLYFFRGGKIRKQTLDHSVPQMLVNLGEIKPKDIRGHEDRNRLLRVIGSPWDKKSFEIEKEITIKNKDAFLLCTDGFWELVDEKYMQKTLKKSSTVEEWMDYLIKEVVRNGESVNMDNNSAIAIWVKK